MRSAGTPPKKPLPGPNLSETQQKVYEMAKRGAGSRRIADALGVSQPEALRMMEEVHAILFGSAREVAWDREPLDKIETAVLYLFSEGKTSKEVGEELGLPERRIHKTANRIFRKLSP